MLSVTSGVGFNSKQQERELYYIVKEMGLLSSLVLCLDSGSASSYSGSGQTFTDVSGSSNNWFLGTSNLVEGNEPTFTGTAGSPTESTYFLCDGNDCFMDNNLSFADNWHNNTASWTFLIGYSPASSASYHAVFTNDTYNGTLNRMAVYVNSGNTQKVAIWTNTHGEVASTNSYNVGSWNIISCTYGAVANTMTWCINGTSESRSVSANAAGGDLSDQQYFLLCSNNGFNMAPNGTKVSFILAWNTALSTTTQQELHRRIKLARMPSAF